MKSSKLPLSLLQDRKKVLSKFLHDRILRDFVFMRNNFSVSNCIVLCYSKKAMMKAKYRISLWD